MNKGLAIAVGLAAVAATASAAAQTEVTVLYAWPSHQRFHEPIAQAFMEEHPGIRITFQAPASSYDEALQTLIRQGMTGSLPDVHFIGYHLLQPLVARDMAIPLDPLIEAETAWSEMGYAEQVLALGRIDGRQRALPFTMSTPVVFYNADLVEQAGADPDAFPNDWDSLIGLAGAIDALGQGVDGMYYELGVDDWTTQGLILNFGGAMMTADETDIAFDGPAGQAAVELFRRFHDEGGQPAIGEEAARQQFVAGKLGMMIASTSGVRGLEADIGDRFTLRTAPLPLADEAEGGVPTGGMAGVILTEDPEKQQAAWDYLKYATGPEGQTIMVRNSGYMPVNSRALGAAYLGGFYETHPNWYTSVRQMPVARPWHPWPGRNGVEIGRTLLDGMTRIAQGTEEPRQALDRMASDVRRLLND